MNELISIETGLRLDGRREGESRRFMAKTSVLNNSTNTNSTFMSCADGACYLEMGNTKVIAAVYGPRDVRSGAGFRVKSSDGSRAILNVEFNVAAFASMSSSAAATRVRGTDKRMVEMGLDIAKALEPACMLESYPKSQIDVFVQVLQNDGGLLAAGVNATCLALIDAGIAMTSYTSATTLSYCPLSRSIIVDPSYSELNVGCMWTVACMRDRVVMMEAEGRVEGRVVEQILQVAREECDRVSSDMDMVIRGME